MRILFFRDNILGDSSIQYRLPTTGKKNPPFYICGGYREKIISFVALAPAAVAVRGAILGGAALQSP